MPPLPLVARYDRRVVLSVELLFPLLWRYLSCSWMLAWEIELPGADLNRLRESVLRPSRDEHGRSALDVVSLPLLI